MLTKNLSKFLIYLGGAYLHKLHAICSCDNDSRTAIWFQGRVSRVDQGVSLSVCYLLRGPPAQWLQLPLLSAEEPVWALLTSPRGVVACSVDKQNTYLN